MIWMLTIKLLPHWKAENEWTCELEIDSSTTLSRLHLAIQKIVGFDNDHLYEFYIAKSERSRTGRVRFLPDPEDDEYFDMLYEEFGIEVDKSLRPAEFSVEKTSLSQVFPLPERMKLFYWFDYGDDWRFQISKKRKEEKRIPKTKYPRIVKEEGIKPIQYDDADPFDMISEAIKMTNKKGTT